MTAIVIPRANAVLFKGIIEVLLRGVMNQEMTHL
jgi:hypothetical protein